MQGKIKFVQGWRIGNTNNGSQNEFDRKLGLYGQRTGK